MNHEATVYVIDDDIEVTESLRWLIESVHYKVVTYPNAESFLQIKHIDEPGCIVLDMRMPNMSGLELQEALNQQHIKIPIIFITGHGDIPMAVRAMKAGAIDFLTKPVNNQILLETINKAIKRSIQQQKDSEKSAELHAKITQLTPREREVMNLMVLGKHTKAIANDLMISPNTVELHRAKVIKKMGVRTVAELVALTANTEV